MYVEVLGLYGIILAGLLIAAETSSDRKILGLFAAVLIFPLGMWIYSDGIQVRAGENTTSTINTFQNQTILDNVTTVINLTTTTNATMAFQYQNVTWPFDSPPFSSVPFDFGEMLGLVTILLGIFIALYYFLNI